MNRANELQFLYHLEIDSRTTSTMWKSQVIFQLFTTSDISETTYSTLCLSAVMKRIDVKKTFFIQGTFFTFLLGSTP